MGKIKKSIPIPIIGNYRKVTKVLDLVSEVCNINRKQLKSNIRLREIVDARRVYAVLCRLNFKLPLTFIGTFIKKDHATILYYVRQHETLHKTDALYRHNYTICEYALKNNPDLAKADNHIDALVAENEHLRNQVQNLEEKLELIHQTTI